MVALIAGGNVEELARQAAEWQPAFVGLAAPAHGSAASGFSVNGFPANGFSGSSAGGDSSAAGGAAANGAAGRELPTGPEVLIEAATHPDVDIVVNAVVGAAGLDATLAALRAGKSVD